MSSSERAVLPPGEPSGFFYAQEVFARAIRHHRAGETDAAKHLYAELIERDIASPDAYNNFGILLSLEHRLPEAIAHVRTAVALDPTSPDFHMNLANMLGEHAAFNEAFDEYDRALSLAPNRPEITISASSAIVSGNMNAQSNVSTAHSLSTPAG